MVFFSAGIAEAFHSAGFWADPQKMYISGPQCQEFFLADNLPAVQFAAVSGEGNSTSRHVLCIHWS